jgi:hypothetical protein
MSKTTHAFELVHSNLWGPFYTSIDGFKYFVIFIDDFFKVTWVYLLKAKHDVFDYFKDFYLLAINQFLAHIKIFWSDNGTEYMSKDMSKCLCSNGIMYQTNCIGTPQQNRKSELKNHDLLKKIMSSCFKWMFPKVFGHMESLQLLIF